ncbi:Rhodanese-like domain-containing protein [Phyllosticta citriasiana]|uniref:Rhodanese-like domain-containing protein n=1 Tax=Phyllosticta citriasiana TaxID=595635 RepID=A0ABR1KX03_9PEZI
MAASTRATVALTRLSASTPRAAAQAPRSFGAWTKATAMSRRAMPITAVRMGMRHNRSASSGGAGDAPPKQPDSFAERERGQGEDEGEEVPSKIYKLEDIQQLVSGALPYAQRQWDYLSDSSKPLLIDVRTPAEYSAGAIPSAVNVPVTTEPEAFFASPDDWEDKFGFPKPEFKREVVFYCKAGVRSHAAAQLAKYAGYESVGEYPGSWLDWERQQKGQAKKE